MRAKSHVCRSYRGKTGKGGPFCPPHPHIQNRVKWHCNSLQILVLIVTCVISFRYRVSKIFHGYYFFAYLYWTTSFNEAIYFAVAFAFSVSYKDCKLLYHISYYVIICCFLVYVSKLNEVLIFFFIFCFFSKHLHLWT